MTILAIVIASRYVRGAIAWAAAADLDLRGALAYARRMRQQFSSLFLAILAGLLLAACPKPQPEPVPADCQEPGSACAGHPQEAPPQVGTVSPPR